MHTGQQVPTLLDLPDGQWAALIEEAFPSPENPPPPRHQPGGWADRFASDLQSAMPVGVS